jgi:hypothetical protein
MGKKKFIMLCIVIGIVFYGSIILAGYSKIESSNVFKVVVEYVNNDIQISDTVGVINSIKPYGSQISKPNNSMPFSILNVKIKGTEATLKAEFRLLYNEENEWYVKEVEYK